MRILRIKNITRRINMSIIIWRRSQYKVWVLFLMFENILIWLLLTDFKLDNFIIEALACCKLNEIILVIDSGRIIMRLLLDCPIWVQHWLVISIRQQVIYTIIYFYWLQLFFVLAYDYLLAYWVDWIIVILVLRSL